LYTTTPAPKTPSPHAMTKFAPIPQSHLLACYKPKRCKQISLVTRSHDGDDDDDDDDDGDDDDDDGDDAAAAVADDAAAAAGGCRSGACFC